MEIGNRKLAIRDGSMEIGNWQLAIRLELPDFRLPIANCSGFGG